MFKNLAIASILGGLVMFIWSFISHAVLPLGEAGVKSLPNEEAIASLLKSSITKSALYIFPGMGEHPGMTAEEKRAAMEKMNEGWRTRPTGVLIYNTRGHGGMTGNQLGIELLSNILSVLIVAFLFSKSVAGLPGLFNKFFLQLPSDSLPHWRSIFHNGTGLDSRPVIRLLKW